MTYLYTLYGLILSVPFPCPMLTPADTGDVPDITVVEGQVPRSLAAPISKELNWQATPTSFLLLGGRRAGRFLVEDGNRITLHRNPAAEDEILCALFLTYIIVALLLQRGFLVLHANVVITPSGAIAISGESGAGKSTTNAALLARGCNMVTDDVTVLCLGKNNSVQVLPGVPKLNLCEDAAINLGHNINRLLRNPLRDTKVVVSIAPGDRITEPVPLKTLYLLGFNSGKTLITTPLAGAAKFTALQECLYGPLFPDAHPKLFPLLTALTEQINMVRLERPSNIWSVNEVVEAILHG